MTGRAWSESLLCGWLVVCLSGCQQGQAPQGGPLSAGPYPESRSIIEWIRIKTDDPEAHVLRWGPREEQKIEGVAKDKLPVTIEVHYQATIGDKLDGRWKQTLRVTGRQIQEETPRVAE